MPSDQALITRTIEQARQRIAQVRAEGKTIGFVPTLGGLHEGHFSLIRCCRAECDFTVVSVFVNPTQFGPAEDYRGYPRTFEADRAVCAELGVDMIFAPDEQAMYPQANLTWIEVAKLTEGLCGAQRPGHFRGVCTVVAKLFNIITPDAAYFGRKDAQQLAVISRMVADLNMNVRIRACPTVRQENGLALSTRNQYLSGEQRRQAGCLYRALERAAALVAGGEVDVAAIVGAMTEIIEAEPEMRIDYICIVDNDLLQSLEKIDRAALIGLAVFCGSARLIDSIVVDP